MSLNFADREEPDYPQDNQKTVSSEELFQGREVVMIRHHDAVYRLIVTKQGKLVLNK